MSRTLISINLILFITLIVCFWLPVGVYPAASSGDDTWFAEPAYHLVQGGELKRSWTDGEFGSATRDYFPPVAPVITAGMFAVMGVNAFSDTAQAPLIATLLAISVVLLMWRGGVSGWLSLATGVAIFGLQIVFNHAVHVRTDADLTAFLLLSLLFQSFASGGGIIRRMFFSLLAGLSLGVACLAYYPMAPFALIAGLWGADIKTKPGRNSLILVLAGGCLCLIAMLAFIAPYPSLFLAQMTHTGANYFYWSRLLEPFLNVFTETGLVPRLMAAEAMLVIVISFFVLKVSREKSVRNNAVRALIMIIPYFLVVPAQCLMASGIFMMMALAGCAHTDASQGSGNLTAVLARSAVLAALCLGLLNAGMLSATAYLQKDARNYARLAGQLKTLVHPDGRAAIDLSAWLALRPQFPASDLHMIVDSGSPQEFVFRSRVLRGADAWKNFRYVVVKRGGLPAFLRDYPGFTEAFKSGLFQKSGEATLPCHRVLLAKCPVYDLLIYKRHPD